MITDVIKRALPLLGLAAVSAAILIAVFFWAPGDISENQVRRVYFADNISPAHLHVIDLFNRMHRGRIEVVPVNLPFDKFSTNERKELLARSLRNKSDRIDIFAVDQIWVPRFLKWSEPLSRYISHSDQENILGYGLESCIYESTLVALPLYIDIGLMYYRKDLIRTLPDADAVEARLKQSISWGEFLSLADRFPVNGAPFYTFQANDYEGLLCNYFEILAGQGDGTFHRDTIDLGSPEAHIALQMMVDFVHKNKISPETVTEFDENRSYSYMLDHNGVFVRGWPNFLENYSVIYPDKAKLANVDRAAIPHFPGHHPAAVFGGWNLMLSKFSVNKPEALEFIRYLQSEETQKIMYEIAGFLPTNVRVYADTAYVNAHPGLAYYRTLLDYGVHRPALVEYTKMSDILSHFIQRAIKRELSVDEALRQAAALFESEKVFAKQRD